jgi:hypothetical protein
MQKPMSEVDSIVLRPWRSHGQTTQSGYDGSGGRHAALYLLC